jgi:hypothetical protein
LGENNKGPVKMKNDFHISKLIPQPYHFGSDPITTYIKVAINNIYSTYIKKSDAFSNLKLVEKQFSYITKNISSPNDIYLGLLLTRTHGYFLSSTQLAMAGQVTESYSLIRGCLECSAYALHIHTNKNLEDVWLNRNMEEASKRACRKAFQITSIKQTLSSYEPRLEEIWSTLYELTIDFGAHPNQASILSTSKIDNQEDSIHLQNRVISSSDLNIDLSLKTVYEAGICALLIFEKIKPEFFKILGISQELEVLRNKKIIPE